MNVASHGFTGLTNLCFFVRLTALQNSRIQCRVNPGSSCERPAKGAGTPVIRHFRQLFRSIATVFRCLSKSMNQSTADWTFCDKLAAPQYNRNTAASILGTRNV